jgi:D-arabinose 5-phosphate isomerase GutQ
MALGDALGVALMVVRRFTATDFRLNHPAGALGGAPVETDENDRLNRSP